MRNICIFACMVVIELAQNSYADENGNSWEEYNNEVVELYHSGEYDQALIVGRKALQIAERDIDTSPLDLATTLSNMGLQYKMKGEYGSAFPLYERALEINEKALGKMNIEVATVLNNLGSLYAAQGMYFESLGFYKKALNISEILFGLDHQYVINVVKKMEYLYRRTGRRSDLNALKSNYKILSARSDDEKSDDGSVSSETSFADRPIANGLLLDTGVTENRVTRRLDRNADVSLQPVPDNIDSIRNNKLTKYLEDEKRRLNSDNITSRGSESKDSLKKWNPNAYETMEVAFEGYPAKSKIQPLMEEVMKNYSLLVNEENLGRVGSMFVALRKESKVGVTEMEILKEIYQNGSTSNSLPDQAAISFLYLEKTK